MTQQQIIDRILKVKALADRGIDGEREAAECLLKDLMEKYHITDADLGEEIPQMHIIRLGDPLFKHLFIQLYSKLYGKDRPVYDIRKMPKKDKKILSDAGFGDKDADAAIECTPSEFIEIRTLFSIYKDDYERQFKVFRYAYYDRNDLLIESTNDDRELTEEELEHYRKAALMSMVIEKKQIHKMIES